MAISIEDGRLIGVVRRRFGVKLAAIAGVLGVSRPVLLPRRRRCRRDASQAGVTVLCPFVSTGSEQQFVVPPGVFSIGVSAVGGKGGAGATNSGSGGTGGAGAFGAVVIGQLAVTPGQVLYLEVAGNGQSAPDTGTAGAGGFNGGGGGVTSAAARPAAVAAARRTFARARVPRSSCTLGTSSDPRLLLAAGGGGGGAGLNGNGGAGGAAGPFLPRERPAPLRSAAGAAGKRGGSVAAGGAGGAGGTPFLVPPSSGTDGSAGQGGSGSAATRVHAGHRRRWRRWLVRRWRWRLGRLLQQRISRWWGRWWRRRQLRVARGKRHTGLDRHPIDHDQLSAPTQAAVVSPASLSFGTQPQSTISAPKRSRSPTAAPLRCSSPG